MMRRASTAAAVIALLAIATLQVSAAPHREEEVHKIPKPHHDDDCEPGSPLITATITSCSIKSVCTLVPSETTYLTYSSVSSERCWEELETLLEVNEYERLIHDCGCDTYCVYSTSSWESCNEVEKCTPIEVTYTSTQTRVIPHLSSSCETCSRPTATSCTPCYKEVCYDDWEEVEECDHSMNPPCCKKVKKPCKKCTQVVDRQECHTDYTTETSCTSWWCNSTETCEIPYTSCTSVCHHEQECCDLTTTITSETSTCSDITNTVTFVNSTSHTITHHSTSTVCYYQEYLTSVCVPSASCYYAIQTHTSVVEVAADAVIPSPCFCTLVTYSPPCPPNETPVPVDDGHHGNDDGHHGNDDNHHGNDDNHHGNDDGHDGNDDGHHGNDDNHHGGDSGNQGGAGGSSDGGSQGGSSDSGSSNSQNNQGGNPPAQEQTAPSESNDQSSPNNGVSGSSNKAAIIGGATAGGVGAALVAGGVYRMARQRQGLI